MATAQQVTESNEAGQWYYGSWTSETSAADHTMTFPCHLAYIQVMVNTSGTNPSILTKHVGESNETVVQLGTDTGTTAHVVSVIETPTDATGITLTNYSNGTCKVLVDSNYQVASGVNCWMALCKP